MNKEELDKFAKHMVETGQADRYIRDHLIGWAVAVPIVSIVMILVIYFS